MEEEKKNVTPRDMVALSTVKSAVVLMVVMVIPILILGLFVGFTIVGRLLIAVLFGVLAIVFAKKADKLDIENDTEKAVKAAKNAKGFNIVQLVYGIFSWISVLLIVMQLL